MMAAPNSSMLLITSAGIRCIAADCLLPNSSLLVLVLDDKLDEPGAVFLRESDRGYGVVDFFKRRLLLFILDCDSEYLLQELCSLVGV